ncbi:hypothetical protein RCL1_005396 [Eukaryota sp. TZLM3-RCL]
MSSFPILSEHDVIDPLPTNHTVHISHNTTSTTSNTSTSSITPNVSTSKDTEIPKEEPLSESIHVPEEIPISAQTDFFAEFLRPGKLPITANGTMDAVVTFVNGSDPLWFESRKQRALELNIEVEAERAQWDDVGELVFCLRSLYYKLPMIRHVFLVLSGPSQIPFWLNPNNPFITIIYHEEIFADSSLLPVFSSYAIEANLWRIPGLSENFFYLNDDMAFIRSLPESMIIDPLDKSRLVHVEHWWAPTAPKGNQFNRGLFQSGQLLSGHFTGPIGLKAWHAMAHTWYPLNRKVMAETSQVFSNTFELLTRHPFRPPTGLPHFMHLSNHYWVQKSLRTQGEVYPFTAKYHLCWNYEYVFNHIDNEIKIEKYFNNARKHSSYSVCFNDPGYHNPSGIKAYRKNMTSFLPEQAPWENMDPFKIYDANIPNTRPVPTRPYTGPVIPRNVQLPRRNVV